MIELAALPNPFRDTIVQDAWQSPADVPEIHADVFRACLAGIDSAARGVPDSLLILGPAGSGKTHLLTRVQRHLAKTAASAPDRAMHCVFVFVRLQTTPSMIWQHLRRRLATDLMRRDQGVTQLQRLVAHQMSARGTFSPRAQVMALRVLGTADQETLTAHLTQVSQDLALPRDLRVVLEHLVCGRLVRDASGWLAGESLPDSALAELGVASNLEEDREEAARELVTALCRLAGETLPIVFCFDQVEAMQRSREDREAFYRFGRMAADLCDADRNVFLITCIQSAVLEALRASIRDADRDRMAKREISLDPLSPAQVEKLVSARLDLVPELAASSEEAFYPFRNGYVQRLATLTPCVPRHVLNAAAHEFEALQCGKRSPVQETPALLAKDYEERAARIRHSSEPYDTKRILLQGLEPLAVIGAVTFRERDLGSADFVLAGEREVFVEIRDEADGRSLGPRLRRLLANTPRQDGARTVIVRDPRLPISKQAVKTREYLQALQTRGVPVVEPTVEALAALAALSEILADAKSGDLACDGAPVSGSDVLQWLRGLRSDLSVEPVRELLSALLREPDHAAGRLDQDLAEVASRERVLRVTDVASQLEVPVESLLEIARKRADRFLLLEGPPEVLVDVAGVAPEAEG